MKFSRIIRCLLPSSVARAARSLISRFDASLDWSPHQVPSYSQEGEDLILNRIFGHREPGFYVDVGAHHPMRFSNTYFFYRMGWRGINIDAMPGSMAAFHKARPRDISLEIPVMEHEGVLTYYQFNEPALNGFSKSLSDSRDGKGGYHITSATEIRGLPLHDILNRYLPENMEIDFLSVDVEGLDLEVLRSNDWSRYRPKVVMAELLESSLSNMSENPVYDLMEKNGYQLFAKSMNTAFFLSDEFLALRSIQAA